MRKGLRSRAGALALGVLLALGPWTPVAAREGYEARFTLSLGGLRLAELSLSAEIAPADYAAEARLSTAGLLDAVYRAGFTARASGRRAGTAFVPLSFEAETAFGDDRQDLAIRYGAGRPLEVTADPPFRPKPWEIDPRAQTGAADPLSAALALFAPQAQGALCNRTVESFDGRKRTRLSLGPPERRGRLIRCAGLYERLAGFKPDQMEEPRFPFAAWFARGPDALWSLDRAAAPTPFGTAVLKRQAPGG